ncbi:uncharacterized protein LOC135498925 [Lineus longissimus]|uniref:uncharacterized protein LOC135498925 n=1 Tax=Lineus longissimus TaxID=88925 RepID=UPI00315D0450
MIPKRIKVQSATFDVDFCNFFSSFSIECSGGAIKTDSLDLMVPLQTLTSSYSLFSPAFSSRFVDTVAKYTGLRITLSVGKTDLPEDVKYYLGDDASNSSLDVIYITCFLKEDLLDLTMAFVPAVCSGLVNQPDLHFNSILAKFAHQLLKTPAPAKVFSTKESTSGVFLDLVQFSMDAYNAVATSANSNTDERPAQDCFRWLRAVLNFLDSEAVKFSCAATGFAFRVLPHAVSSDAVEYIFSAKTWDRACFYLLTVKDIASLVLETDSPAQLCFASMGKSLSPVADRLSLDSRCATPVKEEHDISTIENPLLKLQTELKALSTAEEPKQHIKRTNNNGGYLLNEGSSQTAEIPLPEVVSNDVLEEILAEQTRPMMCLSPIAKTTVLHREEEDNYEHPYQGIIERTNIECDGSRYIISSSSRCKIKPTELNFDRDTLQFIGQYLVQSQKRFAYFSSFLRYMYILFLFYLLDVHFPSPIVHAQCSFSF